MAHNEEEALAAKKIADQIMAQSEDIERNGMPVIVESKREGVAPFIERIKTGTFYITDRFELILVDEKTRVCYDISPVHIAGAEGKEDRTYLQWSPLLGGVPELEVKLGYLINRSLCDKRTRCIAGIIFIVFVFIVAAFVSISVK